MTECIPVERAAYRINEIQHGGLAWTRSVAATEVNPGRLGARDWAFSASNVMAPRQGSETGEGFGQARGGRDDTSTPINAASQAVALLCAAVWLELH